MVNSPRSCGTNSGENKKRGQAMEIDKKQLRKANVLCRGAGLKAPDPNADRKLMETSWKKAQCNAKLKERHHEFAKWTPR